MIRLVTGYIIDQSKTSVFGKGEFSLGASFYSADREIEGQCHLAPKLVGHRISHDGGTLLREQRTCFQFRSVRALAVQTDRPNLVRIVMPYYQTAVHICQD